MAKSREAFANVGYVNVTESAANTLTFNGLSVFSNVLSQKGMLIHRVEYSFSSAEWELLVADDDGIIFGIAGSDNLTSISLDDPEVYDYNFGDLGVYGTGDSRLFTMIPFVKQWNDLPGGGMLVPADRLFGYVQGVNLASAAGCTIRFWYTIMDMSPQDYLELAQAMRVLK